MKTYRTGNFKSIPMILLVLIPVLSFRLSAQTEKNNSLKEGAWALQFQVDNNFTLKSFQGAVISGKYHISASKAIRVGISGNYSLDDQNSNVSTVPPDTITFQEGNTRTNKNFGFSITMQFMSYINPEKEVLLFWGVGPVIQYGKSNNELRDERNSYYYQPIKEIRVTDSHTWGLGASAVLGVEWFATKSFSLHAEYGIVLLYSWSEYTGTYVFFSPASVIKNKSSNGGNNKSWSFNASYVKLGLSVYF